MPWLERNFLWLLPERRKIHQDLDEFLEMLDEIIIHKRQVLADGSTAEKDNEKDLLTLMIESENKGEGALTNEELKVTREKRSHFAFVYSWHLLISVDHCRATSVFSSWLVMIPLLMLYPLLSIIWQSIL